MEFRTSPIVGAFPRLQKLRTRVEAGRRVQLLTFFGKNGSEYPWKIGVVSMEDRGDALLGILPNLICF